MGHQDVIAEEVLVRGSFSKEGHSAWLEAVRRIARAQALLWNRTPIMERRAILAEVEAEAQAFEGAQK